MPEKVISHIKMPVGILATGPEYLGDYWQKGMSNAVDTKSGRMKSPVKDDEDYHNKIADPSSNVWGKCLADDFISRAGLTKKEITARHNEKLAKSYEKYKDGLEAAFDEEGKAFKKKLVKGKKHYLDAVGSKLLPFTGSPHAGKGPVALACMWLTKDNVTSGHLFSSYTILAGGPVIITPRSLLSDFKVVLNSRLIQAGSIIVASGYDKAIMKIQNGHTNELVNRFLDETLGLVKFTTGGSSHLDYLMENKVTMVLDIQVARK